MDVFDKILKEHSWKFPKGYPDINNPKDKEDLFAIVKGYIKEEEEIKPDGVISKDEIIKVLQDEEFTPEQLKRIFSSVSSIKYKQEIIDYISSKGKGPLKVAENVYNKMVATGDASIYAEYLSNMRSYSYLGEGGNLIEKFNFVSKELINYLVSLEPSIGRISTGKGEILLSIMLDDVKDTTGGGDIEVNGKEIEVKNKGAVPMGQKAQFGANTMSTVYQLIEKNINPKLGENISFSTYTQKRPFNKIGLAYEDVISQSPDLKDDFTNILDKVLQSEYPGLDFSNIKSKTYVNGDKLDWVKLELDLSKEVVKLYIKNEGFQEIFFLNDQSKKYKRVSTDKLIDLLGNEVKIYFKDGLPRWSYSF